jgi:hypothetical protein
MSHLPGSVSSIRWSSIFPWLILVRAARVAIMARVLLLSLVGVLATQLGWSAIEWAALSEPGDPSRLFQLTDVSPHWMPDAGVEIDANAGVAVRAYAYRGPLVRGWHWASQPVIGLAHAEHWRRWFGLLAAALWTIAVWALFGGAIARIAALYLTHGESIGPIKALRAALARWPSTAGGPMLALVGIVLLALPLMLAGWMVRLDFLAIVISLFWILLILGGFALAIVVIGLAIGWPLMTATVAVERTDAFDGISRAYAYVYQRPLHLVFYIVAAGILGLAAQAGVNLIVGSTLDATRWAVSAGAGEQRATELYRGYIGQPEMRAVRIIRAWEGLFATIAGAFPMAYLFPAATGIYLLLRRQIDAMDLGEVVFDEGDPQGGLPALVTDPATGVSRLANAPPAEVTDAAHGASPPAP